MIKVIEMAIDKLVPYENNPRNNDVAVGKVAASIQNFGFKNPIIIDKNNVIVAGHTRLKAAEQLGLETVPVIMADDLTEEQVKAFRLADNKTGELSGWDFSMLEEELDSIQNIDMSEFGFDVDADINLDDFFEDKEESQEKKEKAQFVKCPCCGELFEMKDEYLQ